MLGAEKLRTKVKQSEDYAVGQSKTAAAVVKHQSIQFSSGVQALVEEVEAALADKPKPTSTPAPDITTSPKEASPSAQGLENVYDAPLPVGFEPPPGFKKPKPPPPPPEVIEVPPAPPPLPLIAPELSELTVSEPIISQLATTIDNLTVFLNSNPAAAEKAHGVIDTAKLDLTNLATRFQKIKEDEQAKLEQQIDDQAREYTVKLLELEMSAQDKLDNQEDDFRKLFNEERANLIGAYREKLSQELQTQSEIINERYAALVHCHGESLRLSGDILG